jgi:formylglycine-generating enzyme required for sulfatase activity
MGKNPARHKRCGDTCPAEQISWEDVQGFIRKLNQKEGTDKYRTGLGVIRKMKW